MQNRLLTLVRHAKSSWKTEGQLDHDRPLNDRGNRDAPIMAERLVKRDCIPDLILCSSAKRTQETAAYFTEAFGFSEDKLWVSKSLYLCTPETMLEQLAIAESGLRHIMIIAHNPGLEQLSYRLSAACNPSMPTLGIRHFACSSLNPLPMANRSQGNASKTDATIELMFEDFPKNIP